MKILLVCPTFLPDKNVSTLRMSFFVKTLSEKNTVDVLKLGNSTNFDGQIKSIDRKYFSSLFKSFLSRSALHKLLKELLLQYDVVYVSVPVYVLLEIARVSINLGKKTYVDIRDLPDLIYDFKSKKTPVLKPVWKMNLLIQEWLIYDILKNVELVTAVGHTATMLIQKKIINHKNVVNVHNGFELSDFEIVKKNRNTKKSEGSIIIGLSGSLRDFRDTVKLRKFLGAVDKLAGIKKIEIRHWGTATASLEKFIKSLENIKYVQYSFIDRAVYLNEIGQADLLLLVCSDSLVWEPTTTVFDYILLNKPVIFVGIYNNEAFSILENSGCEIIKSENFSVENCSIEDKNPENRSQIKMYSREFNFNKIAKFFD